MMRLWKSAMVIVAVAMASLATAPAASAASITFGSLQSTPGLPSIFLDASTFALSSLNLPTPFDPADPFAQSSPISYLQVQPVLGPIPALFTLTPTGVTGLVDPTTAAYGAGTFAIGLNSGANSIPWVSGSFDQMFLTLAGDLNTGTLFSLNSTVYSGIGFDVSGLGAPGSFAFSLGNPFMFRDNAGALVGIGYEITAGVLNAEPVPEPASLLLLGAGLCGLCYHRVRRRANQA